MIFPRTGPDVHPPVGVVPVIALHQHHVARVDQLLQQLRILRKLRTEDLLHDVELHRVPVPAQLHLPSRTLGRHTVHGAERVPHRRIQGFCRLKGGFAVHVGPPVPGKARRVHVAQEAVLPPQGHDFPQPNPSLSLLVKVFYRRPGQLSMNSQFQTPTNPPRILHNFISRISNNVL